VPYARILANAAVLQAAAQQLFDREIPI